MAGTLNLNDLKDEPILYYENAISYVFSQSSEDTKKDLPTCLIYPNNTIKVGFPIHSIKNIKKNDNLLNDNDNEIARFNEEPVVAYASESKDIYPLRVHIYYTLLYIFIFSQLFVMLFFKDNINYRTTGEINKWQIFVFVFMSISHILVFVSKIGKLKDYIFDIYTSLSLFFFILSLLTINCFSSYFIALFQFFIFVLHERIYFYVMAQTCVIPP
ncbi:conserved Plasmodium protein, unknown function [Plasmodium berghei]|uniref:Uncharacterized protein n=2 Tax=Plasmodium berghei TaxID=5821 RepID=A0A509AZF0_PLABA|nr:conserved Plasmodium protein, unknown function [Plasmodium berghei ANKA]CXJ13791.1 conserved Plasmodium protein, unknown function [Plasmodium berghei]SCM26153.1 conserved Plasmodium protein, unknown function [Plasmodium berghei]SCN28305.1 conserved Plasmodium protein, unknown function [Plasmodium berghei]SCO62503.1 conserved Plasmodium protein, unknown function [Plasmodium berghei]SCO64061.1 conserved Plasmodium protein, unknown function [Plasmodium berghei]|eukprot:XP_034423957.1 conserved Plasmodium protein, unknown function [Plasmodium berghei ANKA]